MTSGGRRWHNQETRDCPIWFAKVGGASAYCSLSWEVRYRQSAGQRAADSEWRRSHWWECWAQQWNRWPGQSRITSAVCVLAAGGRGTAERPGGDWTDINYHWHALLTTVLPPCCPPCRCQCCLYIITLPTVFFWTVLFCNVLLMWCDCLVCAVFWSTINIFSLTELQQLLRTLESVM